MKIEAQAIQYTEDGEPYFKMDLLSENRLSMWFRLLWFVRCWRRLEITVTVKKEAVRE